MDPKAFTASSPPSSAPTWPATAASCSRRGRHRQDPRSLQADHLRPREAAPRPRGGLPGDNLLIEFPSVVDAVQKELQTHNAKLPRAGAMLFRIGVNLGT